MDSKNWKKLFSRYYIITHINEGYHKKTLISNYKFIFMAVSRLVKKGVSDGEMLEFIQDVIEVHEKNYFV